MLLEIARTLGYAVITSVVFVFLRPFNSAKATGFAVLRAEGYSLVFVGFFTILLGVLLSRLDLVSDGGRFHFTLLR